MEISKIQQKIVVTPCINSNMTALNHQWQVTMDLTRHSVVIIKDKESETGSINKIIIQTSVFRITMLAKVVLPALLNGKWLWLKSTVVITFQILNISMKKEAA